MKLANRSIRKEVIHLALICGLLTGLCACAGSVCPIHSQTTYDEDSRHTGRISLNGVWKMKTGNLSPSNLYLPAINDRTWKDILIPNNWYLQGVDHAGVVWFRKHFSIDARWKGQIIKLVFEGVDYTADVWLNGHYLGFHEGYFSPFSFSASDWIKPGADNLLVVRVNSPNEQPEAWSLKKRLIKGVLSHHDTRPGGAWSHRGQEKNTGGIWGSIYLKVSRQLTADRVTIKPIVEPENGSARAEITAIVTLPPSSAIAAHAGDVTVDIEISPHNFFAQGHQLMKHTEHRHLDKGNNQLRFDLLCPEARLWWPWELGLPHLYRLNLTFRRNNRILDTISEVFGFRDITCNPSTMVWHVNGKRLFLRGTNYISSQWLSEMTREKYAYDLALMKKANINTIRVHAHVESKNFYHVCDEMGIMVWQDFPLQWGYADDPCFITEVNRQAGEMTRFLYNHPSIIAWCGHNEPPWDAMWMKYKYKNYDASQNKELDEALYQALKISDDSRYVHKYSSTSEHPWFGWYSGTWRDYGKPATIPFISEFGAQALPGYETLRMFLADEALWPDSENDWAEWSYHNFQRKETFEIAGVKKGTNIDEFIANTQQYQAKLIQYATESYRRQRFCPVTGIFQFMFVENWPSVNWGIVDYRRNPKPGYYALKMAFQPLLPSIESEKETWSEGETVSLKMWVINDLCKGVKGADLKYYLKSGEKLLAHGHLKIDILPDSATMVDTFRKSGLPPGTFSFRIVIENSEGKVLAQNKLLFNVLKKEHP